jgi:hypothetical protein
VYAVAMTNTDMTTTEPVSGRCPCGQPSAAPSGLCFDCLDLIRWGGEGGQNAD